MSGPWTTYHVLWDEPGVVHRIVRLRDDGTGLYGEIYVPGTGWESDPRAFDVMRNGQDYDLVPAEEADRLTAELER